MIETRDFDIKKVFFAKKSGDPLRNFWVIFLKNSIFEKPKKPTFSQITFFSRIDFWKIGRNFRKSVVWAPKFFWSQNTIFQWESPEISVRGPLSNILAQFVQKPLQAAFHLGSIFSSGAEISVRNFWWPLFFINFWKKTACRLSHLKIVYLERTPFRHIYALEYEKSVIFTIHFL